MDEHVEHERKECIKPVAAEDDSILDFKSPVQLAKKRSNQFINSNAVQIRKTAIKLKNASKNHKQTKPKQRLKERKSENESQPSIESSFFKSNGSSNNKDPAVDVKVAVVCPLCFKTFNDISSRTSHMKSCANKNNIPTKKLLDAIELQKRQEDERKSLGLLIAPVVQEKKKSVPHRANLYEESNLELALALSKSLQEAEELDGVNENDGLSKMSNPCWLQAKVSVSEKQPKKFGNRRKNGPTVLQTRSEVERKHILTERISEILMADESITQKQNEEQEYDNIMEKETVLKSRLLQDLWSKGGELWNEAKLSGSRKDFYVRNLSEFIIPEVKEASDKKEETIVEFASTCNMPDMKLSQYRIETSNNEKIQDAKNIETSAVRHQECESCQNRPFIDAMINNWSEALNNSSASDIIIFVKNDKHIWAHRLVFYVQYSNILLDTTPNDTSLYTTIKEKICWLDISYEIALAFLEFIYCRVIKKYLYVLDDITSFPCLRNLARKYKVAELFGFLERKEIDVKQETDRVENEQNKELVSEEGNPFELSTDSVENLICVGKDTELNECEKLTSAHSIQKKYVTDKSELIKPELTKEVYPDSLFQQKTYLSDMSAIRNSNVSPDLFDESNDTISSDGMNKIIYVDEPPNPTNGDEDDEDINILSGSQFSTPKRESHSQILKPRNNLSLFIEKVQRENDKSDNDTDSEIQILPLRPKLCRNPFSTKQYDTSDQFLTSTTNTIEGEQKKKKRGVSIFDSMITSEPHANVYTQNHASICEDLSLMNDSVPLSELNTEEWTESYRKDNSMNESVLDTGKKNQDMISNSASTNLLNETTKCSQNVKDIVLQETFFATQFTESIDNISLNSDTDEDEISMYSKYKEGHENNSIVKYRKIMQEHTLKSNANSNVEHDECAERNNPVTDTILLSNVCDSSECRMSRENECDIQILSDVNRKSSISSQRDIFENQKVNNLSKLRYSRSESNIDLQEIRNKLESPTLISLSPAKRSTSWAERTDENNDFLESIYLANVHIDNDDGDDDDNDSLVLIDEVKTLKKGILSPIVPKESGALIVTNNSSTQLKNSDKSLLKNQGIRKFQRKSISEASLHTNKREIKNATSDIYKNHNKTPCKCRHTKDLEVNMSPEIIRDSVTPPPNYDGMLTPDLHAELSKYGLKMQKRKRAVKLLTYIYEELHPTISTTQTRTEPEFAISSEDDEPPEKKKNVDYISNYECQSPTSQEIITGLLLPENVIDEEKVFDEPEFTSVTDDTPNIRDMFVKLITFNKELHNKILAYEPLCLNTVHIMLKEAGFKCKMNTLMDFLDEQCITFFMQENRKKVGTISVEREMEEQTIDKNSDVV